MLCVVCGSEFPNKKSMTNHLQTHDQREFDCQKCGEKIVGVKKFNNHMAGHKTFNCEKCNGIMPFNSRSSHLTKCHSEKEILKCSECEYQTNVKGNFTRHMKSHETKEKEKVRYQCPHCKKIFCKIVHR